MTEQLDLVEACLRRDVGISRVREAAGHEWVEIAATYLREYARRSYGQPFLIEDAADVFTGPRPPNPKAWGPAVLTASKRGWIRKAGYAPARSSNLSPKCLWRA